MGSALPRAPDQSIRRTRGGRTLGLQRGALDGAALLARADRQGGRGAVLRDRVERRRSGLRAPDSRLPPGLSRSRATRRAVRGLPRNPVRLAYGYGTLI